MDNKKDKFEESTIPTGDIMGAFKVFSEKKLKEAELPEDPSVIKARIFDIAKKEQIMQELKQEGFGVADDRDEDMIDQVYEKPDEEVKDEKNVWMEDGQVEIILPESLSDAEKEKEKVNGVLGKVISRKLDKTYSAQTAANIVDKLPKQVRNKVQSKVFKTQNPDVRPSEMLREEVAEESDVTNKMPRPFYAPTGPLMTTDVYKLVKGEEDPHVTHLLDPQEMERFLRETKKDDVLLKAQLIKGNKVEEILPVDDDNSSEIIEDNEGVIIDMDGDTGIEVVGSEKPALVKKTEVDDDVSIIELPLDSELADEDMEKYRRKEFTDPAELDEILDIKHIDNLSDEEKNMVRQAKLRSLPVEEMDDLLGLDFNKLLSEPRREEFRQRRIKEKFGLEDKPKNGKPFGESDQTIKAEIYDLGEELDKKAAERKNEDKIREERINLSRSVLSAINELEQGIKDGKGNDYGAIKLALLKVFAQVQDEVGKHYSGFSIKDESDNVVSLDKRYGELNLKNVKDKVLEIFTDENDQEEFLQGLSQEVKLLWDQEAEEKIKERKLVKWLGWIPVAGPLYRWWNLRGIKKNLHADYENKKEKLPAHYNTNKADDSDQVDFMDYLNDRLSVFSNFLKSENEALLKVARRLSENKSTQLHMLEDINEFRQLKSILSIIESQTEKHVTEKLIEDRDRACAPDLTNEQIDKIAKLTSVCAGLTAEKNYHIKKNSIKDNWLLSMAKWLDRKWYGKESTATAVSSYIAASGITAVAAYAGQKLLYTVGLGGAAATLTAERALRNFKYFNYRKKSAELSGINEAKVRVEEIRSDNVIYKNNLERQDVVIGNEALMMNEQLEKLLRQNVNKDDYDLTGWRQDKVKLDNNLQNNISQIRNERFWRDVKRWGVSVVAGFGVTFGLHRLMEWWHGDIDHPVPDHPDATPSAVPSEVAGETPGDGGEVVIGDVVSESEATVAEEVKTAIPEKTAEIPDSVNTSTPDAVEAIASSKIVTEEDFSDWLQGEAVGEAPDTQEETIENIKNLYYSQSEKLSPERVVQYCDAMHIDCPEAVQKFIENHVDEFGNNVDGYENLRLLLNNTHVVTDGNMKMDDLLDVLNYREDTISHMAGLFDDAGKLDLDLVVDYCHHFSETNINPLHISTDDIYIDGDIKNWLGEAVKSDVGQQYFSHDYNGHRHLRWILNNTNIISDDLTPQQVVRVAQVLERAGIKGTLLDQLGSAGKHELVKKILDNWSAIWARPELLRAVEGDVTNGSQMISDYIYKYGQDWTKFKTGYNL